MSTDVEQHNSGLEGAGHFVVVSELIAELVHEHPCAEQVVVHDHV